MLPSSSSFFHCFNWQGVWRRDYSTTVLRVPPCSLPGMDTFVSASKPNFRVTSTRDPAPLISYHTDGWTPAYSPNSVASAASSHTHEMRASVIMKTSDVTSSWPLTPDEGVSSLLPGHRNDERLYVFSIRAAWSLKRASFKTFDFIVASVWAKNQIRRGLTCPLIGEHLNPVYWFLRLYGCEALRDVNFILLPCLRGVGGPSACSLKFMTTWTVHTTHTHIDM